MDLLIRFEQPADVPAIHAVHVASFPTTGEARLVDALRTNGRLTFSLVAVEADRVIGHVAFSPVALDRSSRGMGLGPVGVLPEWRRRGIAAELIRAGLAACRDAGHAFVVVLGAPKYYARFGFEPATKWKLRCVYTDGPAFQVLSLRDGPVPASGGLVAYAPEFAELG